MSDLIGLLLIVLGYYVSYKIGFLNGETKGQINALTWVKKELEVVKEELKKKIQEADEKNEKSSKRSKTNK